MGVFGIFNAVLLAVWWIGIGAFLRSERQVLGWVTIVLGALALLAWIGGVTGIEALRSIGLPVIFVGTPIWAAWLGIVLLRMPTISPER